MRLRQRPSSRLLIVDAQSRVLLFKFEHKEGPLSGQQFWATPGGGVDDGESYEEAACREMFEETGRRIESPGAQVARRIVTLQLPDGETVESDERFFLIRVGDLEVSDDRWTDLERKVMTAPRWWSRVDLRSAEEQVWPDNLTNILVNVGVWQGED